jgi:hypothetical protein
MQYEVGEEKTGEWEVLYSCKGNQDPRVAEACTAVLA